MFETPNWATRHNYFHHSNPRSKDRAKNIFEKVYVRPLVSQAWEHLKNPNSSEEVMDHARYLIKSLTHNRANAAMKAGVAVQSACDLHLVPDEFGTTLSIPEAIIAAIDEFQGHQIKSDTPNNKDIDAKKKDKYLEEIPLVIEHAIMGLKEAMRYDNRILGEIDLLDTLPGNAVPHNTKPDYGRRGDLKTKWSSLKRGGLPDEDKWTKGYLPSSLTGMFDMNNVFQVAGFWALNGKQPPFLVYANMSDYRVFTPENTPELRDDFLQDVVDQISLHHKTTENILREAEHSDDLFRLVDPDFRALCWQEPDAYLNEAKRVWGLA